MRHMIGYGTSGYVSHSRASMSYRSILSERYQIVDTVTTGKDILPLDCVILHFEPTHYDSLYDQFPELQHKYVVSYCVCEASPLNQAYAQPLSHVQEVWTCSEYCREIISQYHCNVHCIPHVVERHVSGGELALATMRARSNCQENSFVFLNISATGDKRKNLQCLVAAFRKAAKDMPGAHLLIKAPEYARVAGSNDDNITWISEYLTDAEISALYELSHVYVGSHHSEGWGFTLSDAMLFGKPVIATNYSGNLQFMTPSNSFLVACEERAIDQDDCFSVFTTNMKWAYPSCDELAEKMRLTFDHYADSVVTDRVQQAQVDIQQYNRARVAPLLYRRLNHILSLNYKSRTFTT